MDWEGNGVPCEADNLKLERLVGTWTRVRHWQRDLGERGFRGGAAVKRATVSRVDLHSKLIRQSAQGDTRSGAWAAVGSVSRSSHPRAPQLILDALNGAADSDAGSHYVAWAAETWSGLMSIILVKQGAPPSSNALPPRSQSPPAGAAP